MVQETELKTFGAYIQRLISGEHLSRDETCALFTDVLRNRQPDLHQGAFLAALVAKGETPGEIAGAWKAILEEDTIGVQPLPASQLVENSGTGMDKLKTFNVSTAAGIVAASGGLKVARHGSRALTSKIGTVDIMESLGLNVECSLDIVADCIRTIGIGLFNGMSSRVHPGGLARILAQIRFGSSLNIAASLASPCRISNALRGVYSQEMVVKTAQVMREIGYRRVLVVHGTDVESGLGMDEISPCGPTYAAELYPDGRIKEITLEPEEFGCFGAAWDEIKALENLDPERLRFLSVMAGKGFEGCILFTAINAGALFYIMGITSTLQKGAEKALTYIHGGKALGTLSRWIARQDCEDGSGFKRFNALCEELDLPKA